MNEEHIHKLAYQIWLAEGCPEGQAERHWRMACEQAKEEVTPTPDEADHLPGSVQSSVATPAPMRKKARTG